jgi:hypothetical protein
MRLIASAWEAQEIPDQSHDFCRRLDYRGIAGASIIVTIALETRQELSKKGLEMGLGCDRKTGSDGRRAIDKDHTLNPL